MIQTLAHHLKKWAVLWSVISSLVVLGLDYLTSSYISFPIFFIFPVALVAWFGERRWAFMLAIFLCGVRLGTSYAYLEISPVDQSLILVNAANCLVVLLLAAVLIARLAKQQRALEVKVRTLEGFLPVCGFCKKIRNADDKWESLETFICRNSEAQFSHSVCPDCGREHYPGFFDAEEKKPEPASMPK